MAISERFATMSFLIGRMAGSTDWLRAVGEAVFLGMAVG
jgi:hypothetical protein